MSTNSNGLSKHLQVVNQAPPPIPHQNPPSTLMQVKVSPGNPPWSETVVVTPEQAEYWLRSNTRNRVLRKSRVRVYARDMKAGRWSFSTQGITFGTDGSLLDGQHRLSAVVMAGVSVTMVVWFNVPPSARAVIDIGAPRTFADVADLSKRQAAVTAAMMRGLYDNKQSTMAEKIIFYRQFANAIDGTIARFQTTHKGFTQATVLGAIARASLHLSQSDLDHFCTVLQSGMPSDDPRDAVIIKLRDRLMQGFSSSGGSSVIKLIYGLTAAALRAFSDGRVLAKLSPVSNDPFPLPEYPNE